MGITSFDVLQANGVISPQTMMTTGKVFFVGNSTVVPEGGKTGSNGNSGLSPLEPFATIDYAIGRCVANRGDIIYVLPGHSETITAAGGIDCDVAGISIIGIGNKNTRPIINFSTATTADMDIDAADITIKNMRFDLTGIDAVVAAIDVNAAGFRMEDCWILMADSGGQAVLGLVTDANADELKILNCEFLSPNAGADAAIRITGTPDDVEIGGCRIIGDFSDACIHNPTGNVATNLYIHHNYVENVQTGDHCIELVSACTGTLAYNSGFTDLLQATGIDPGSCKCIENYTVDTIDVSGILTPVAT